MLVVFLGGLVAFKLMVRRFKTIAGISVHGCGAAEAGFIKFYHSLASTSSIFHSLPDFESLILKSQTTTLFPVYYSFFDMVFSLLSPWSLFPYTIKLRIIKKKKKEEKKT